jgi:hypothetical protein
MASQVTQYLFFFALAAGSMAAIAHGSSLPSASRSTAFAQNALFLKVRWGAMCFSLWRTRAGRASPTHLFSRRCLRHPAYIRPELPIR